MINAQRTKIILIGTHQRLNAVDVSRRSRQTKYLEKNTSGEKVLFYRLIIVHLAKKAYVCTPLPYNIK